MAIEVREQPKSPSYTVDGKNTQCVRRYRIFGTNDDDAAYAAFVTAAPTSATIAGWSLTRVVYQLDPNSEGYYEAQVSFSRRETETGESQYQFETTGGTVHVDRSVATVQSKRAGGGTAPSFGGLIGVNGEEVAGCDIIVPTFSFSETHTLSNATVDGAYKLALFAATGKVNNAGFKGFSTGEVLFLGASGTQRNGEDWEVNFRFLAAENQSGLTVGGITGINKKGHEYLWVHFANDVSEQRLVKKIDTVLVEQVYQTHNFANIGIGT